MKRVLSDDAMEETVRIYARAYIMMLLSTQLFGDKSGNQVHIRWLPFVARLDDMRSYSWESAALAWLYRCMCRVDNRNVTNFAGPLQLLQSWIFWRFPSLKPRGFDTYSFPLASRYTYLYSHLLAFIRPQGGESRLIVWEPYASLDVMVVVHSDILTEEHSRLWRTCTCLIYFAVIEWHQVDRVLPQLGGDGKGGDRWFPNYYQVWHLSWQNRVDAILSIPRVPDHGPSTDFLRWWYRVALIFLSPDSLIADPRAEEISQDVAQRGSSQAPSRVPMQDVPDNRRVERQRRIGTQATNRKWRWLDDMI
ncbi:hypothetical protein Ahy_A08g038165 [Arachis hypogaea]|uniref:Aminotransferase-like plant mobile domain-containing protein n=1 Tax=Arachis hypogaea TaxID=3818 RepID=A0A445BSS9_ARAHY|nr:hypothetical protein Ahy_A08g038165 [Arachis hypogaea]